jgi:glutathione S-transferase
VNKPILCSVLFLALAAAGCEKSTDYGRMQEETLTLVKLHGSEIDVLQRRADALMARGRNLGGQAPGIADAGRMLSEARAGLDQLRAQVAAAPTTISGAAKAADNDQFLRVSDELMEKLDNGETAVRSDLAAVDNWLASVENRPASAPPPPPAPAAKTDEAPAAPPAPPAENPSGTGSGSAAGSGAPAAQK